MSDLIHHDFKYLLTLERFQIPLGFGDHTIADVCSKNNVDLSTFLLVVNTFEDSACTSNFPSENINIPLLVNYLKRTHRYFIDYRLPEIRSSLRLLIADTQEPHKSLLLDFFDKYKNEVIRHMNFEEKNIYPYVIDRYIGRYDGTKNIEYYEKHHNDIEKKLNDLRNIILKYLPPMEHVHKANDLLYALFQAEEDLNRHTFVEEHLLFPAVQYYESKTKNDDE